jgi:hypothetical protein
LKLKYNLIGIVFLIIFISSPIFRVATNEEPLPEWKLEVSDKLKWQITKFRKDMQEWEGPFFWLGNSTFLTAKEGDFMEIKILDLSEITDQPILTYSAKCEVKIGDNEVTDVEMAHYGSYGVYNTPDLIWFYPDYSRDYYERLLAWYNESYTALNINASLDGDIFENKLVIENQVENNTEKGIQRRNIAKGYLTYWYNFDSSSDHSDEREVILVKAPGWNDTDGFFDISGFELLSNLLGMASVTMILVVIRRKKASTAMRK